MHRPNWSIRFPSSRMAATKRVYVLQQVANHFLIADEQSP